MKSVAAIVAIEPYDRHASSAKRARNFESGDVTVEYQRRGFIGRVDLLAYGGDELAWIVNHVW